jgi:hypothetical protein
MQSGLAGAYFRAIQIHSSFLSVHITSFHGRKKKNEISTFMSFCTFSRLPFTECSSSSVSCFLFEAAFGFLGYAA